MFDRVENPSRPEANTPVVDLRRVSKAYSTPNGAFVALKNVDLTVQAGEFVAVVGRSGSGKSTLLNLITGIDRPTTGEVWVAGSAVHALNENQVAVWRGRTVGVVFQFFQLLPTLTVLLYRLRLGWLLGHRFMQITHVGRKSGKVRRTILAVLRYDDTTKEIYAVSAWKGSDWYYNIQAAPAVLVETGFVRYVPQQRELIPEEIATAFTAYLKAHPYFGRMVCRIPGWKWESTEDEFLTLARTLRGVAFRPQ